METESFDWYPIFIHFLLFNYIVTYLKTILFLFMLPFIILRSSFNYIFQKNESTKQMFIILLSIL